MDGFAGTLAGESETAGNIGGETKAHFDAKLRVLLALHRFSKEKEFDLIVGQPISRHLPEDKKAIKEMLIGSHVLVVNGERKTIVIRRCEVAAEGIVAGLLTTSQGIVRVLDVGSATVNFGTLQDMNFMDLGSWSELLGMETFDEQNPVAIGRKIVTSAQRKWKPHDVVKVCGGGAEMVFPYIKPHFPNAELIKNPIYANVKAFYDLARKAYG